MISWFSFVARATLGQFTTYVFPAQRCRMEKRQLAVSRQKDKSVKEYNENILVSVIIPTYNRSELLSSYAVPSVLNQTHRNLELIVVGDHCTDDTELKLKKFQDHRIKFINMPKQGDYPKITIWRWLVAGVDPLNVGLDMARGEWITNLDDDTEFSPNHLESLLKFALENDYELVHGLLGEKSDASRWIYRGRPDYINNSTVLYKNYLKLFKSDPNCWRINEPADGNRWKRMILSEVRIGFSGKDCGVRCLAKQQSRYAKQGKTIKQPENALSTNITNGKDQVTDGTSVR